VKFGAIVGDGCRIGANAVLAPGTILSAKTVVQRLSLIDQRPDDQLRKNCCPFSMFSSTSSLLTAPSKRKAQAARSSAGQRFKL
jgi:carbonic anhydrase/acetyltransferase-like protein (isoleucine patch superfamily)